MPIVHLTLLPPPEPAALDRALEALTIAVAEAVDCPAGDVWVYAHLAAAVQMGERRPGFVGHCPVVEILARPRAAPDAARALEAAARAVSEALGLPIEDVWATWRECPQGRVFAGGEPR